MLGEKLSYLLRTLIISKLEASTFGLSGLSEMSRRRWLCFWNSGYVFSTAEGTDNYFFEARNPRSVPWFCSHSKYLQLTRFAYSEVTLVSDTRKLRAYSTLQAKQKRCLRDINTGIPRTITILKNTLALLDISNDRAYLPHNFQGFLKIYTN